MKIPKACAVHKTASKDAGRYALDYVKLAALEGTGPCLAATDGRVLAVLPVKLEPGDAIPEAGELIPADVFKTAAKGRKTGTYSLTVNGRVTVETEGGALDCGETGRDAKAEWPPLAQVIPDAGKLTQRVALNPHYLMKVVDALGIGKDDAVILEYGSDEYAPVLVKPAADPTVPGAFGLVMPVTVDGPVEYGRPAAPQQEGVQA